MNFERYRIQMGEDVRKFEGYRIQMGEDQKFLRIQNTDWGRCEVSKGTEYRLGKM